MSISGIGVTNIDILYSGLDKLPNIGEEIYSKDFDIQLGGGTAGTIVNLARLGINVNLLTMLGDDLLSRFAYDKYKKANVNIINLFSDNITFPLNVTSAMILPEDRSFVSYGAGTIKFSDNSHNKLKETASNSKIVLMQTDGFLDTYKELKESGCTLVLDVGWTDDLSLDKIKDYLEIANYFTPNKKEALKITGCDNVNNALDILHKYLEKVIIKLDKDGCLGYDGEKFIVPSIENTNCIDSTGAGDAFLAGFCYGLYHDYDFRDCILLGNLTGAKCVTCIGALSSYYSEDELLSKYREIKKA